MMIVIKKYLNNKCSNTLLTSTIRKNHSIFRKISLQGTRIILRQAKLIKLKPSQLLYKEGYDERVCYIVLYGRVVVLVVDEGILGIMSSGESIGEECLLIPSYNCR